MNKTAVSYNVISYIYIIYILRVINDLGFYFTRVFKAFAAEAKIFTLGS